MKETSKAKMHATEKAISDEALTELFVQRHPSWSDRLQTLSEHFTNRRGAGVFAPIKGGSCSACRVKIATARLQLAQSGEFITCANCTRFLYLADKVLPEGPGDRSS